MIDDKKIRNGIFAVAVVGLVVASVAGSAFSSSDGYKGPNITVNGHENFDTDYNDDWDEGKFESEDRTVENFSKIKVLGAVKLDVTAGEDQTVTVSSKPDYLERVKTWVDGDTLYIDSTNDKKRSNNGMKARVKISMAAFEAIYVEGAISGRFNSIDSSDVLVHVEGASDMKLSGTCENITIKMEGASNIDADKLECKNADVSLEGVGNIEAYASEKVYASLEGMGNIDVSGGATDVTKNKDGFGNIDIN